METNVDKAVEHLLQSKDAHLTLGKEMLEVSDGDAFPMDFLSAAVLNRSLALIEGFCSLISNRNFLAAAPLLRLQLDNLLRLSAAWQVDNPHAFVTDVLSGTHIRNIQDRHGNKMTDHYLVGLLAKEDDQIKSVYENTSAFIHLSDKHMFAIFLHAGEERTLNIQIGPDAHQLPDDKFLEAVVAFSHYTRLVLKYVHGWAFTKANPDAVTSRNA